MVSDFNYFENMDRMMEKYSKPSLSELSKEKLTFDEIVTIHTWIEMAVMAVTVKFQTDAGRTKHSPKD